MESRNPESYAGLRPGPVDHNEHRGAGETTGLFSELRLRSEDNRLHLGQCFYLYA